MRLTTLFSKDGLFKNEIDYSEVAADIRESEEMFNILSNIIIKYKAIRQRIRLSEKKTNPK